MRRILTGLVAAFLTIVASVEAQALVFNLGPGDSISINGLFACQGLYSCPGGDLYEFTVTQPVDFDASVTLNNFADVTFRLFPNSSPGTPLDEWFASSPGTSTLTTLSFSGLLPGILYNFSIDGFVPASGRDIGTGGYTGSLGVGPASAVQAVSAVPLPGAIWLFGSGLALLLGFARRR